MIGDRAAAYVSSKSRGAHVAAVAIGILLAGCGRDGPRNLTDEQTDELIVSMMEKLEEPDPRGKVVAAMFLGGQGEKASDAIPLLQNLTKDNDPAVRQAATAALSKLQGVDTSD